MGFAVVISIKSDFSPLEDNPPTAPEVWSSQGNNQDKWEESPTEEFRVMSGRGSGEGNGAAAGGGVKNAVGE